MKLITLESLQHFKSKLDGLFVAKEKKTNSDSEYKVLSDNNLTDEMVLKITPLRLSRRYPHSRTMRNTKRKAK